MPEPYVIRQVCDQNAAMLQLITIRMRSITSNTFQRFSIICLRRGKTYEVNSAENTITIRLVTTRCVTLI